MITDTLKILFLWEGVKIALFNIYKKNAEIKKAYKLSKHGKYQEALECYDNILKKDQNYTDAWYGKGVALRKLGKLEEALKATKVALKLDHKYVDVWM